MRDLEKYFERKSIDYDKLLKYGFVKNKNIYHFETKICDDNFVVIVSISKDEKYSKVIDLSFNEEYILVDVKKTSGNFVGKVKEEYENILDDIIDKCCYKETFKENQSKDVIRYIKDKYNDDLEYLWEKSPNNAIWRNKFNQKWYGILMVLKENKLGIVSNRTIEIINVRYNKDKIHEFIDNEKIFAGYHMNKNNWITIRLDGSIKNEDIFNLIDNSYQISLKK